MPATYPLDTTGVAGTNLIQGEIHTLTKINASPYRILIPDFAPFYLNNLGVLHIASNGDQTPLNEGVDFYVTLPYVAATRASGKSVYGGLAFINEFAQGTIRITYQTVGGEFACDPNYVYERLLSTVYNPRTSWWDTLTNVQELFPPIDHDHTLDDVHQVDVLFQSLENIRAAILQAPASVPGVYLAHMAARNPHGLTKEDLGCTPAASMDFATDQEIILGEGLDKLLTHRQVIALLRKHGLI